ncbi:MAG TPA: tail fiber protein, partial [Coleofasciculaceae cyanobacterium]
MPDWGLVSPIASVAKDRGVTLTGVGVTLLFSAIEGIEDYYNWTSNGNSLTGSEWDEISRAIEATKVALMSSTMIGAIIEYCGNEPDTNWLPCDGAFYLSGDYPELYAVISSAFKTPTGFYTPDFRRKVGVGSGSGFNVGDTGGEENHTLTLAEIPTHTHSYTAPALIDLDLEDIGVPQPAAGINPLPQETGQAGSGS